jgi:hypothetical protein
VGSLVGSVRLFFFLVGFRGVNRVDLAMMEGRGGEGRGILGWLLYNYVMMIGIRDLRSGALLTLRLCHRGGLGVRCLQLDGTVYWYHGIWGCLGKL